MAFECYICDRTVRRMYLIVTTAHSTIQLDVNDLAFCCANLLFLLCLACASLFTKIHHANMKHVAVASLVSKMLVASLVSIIYSTVLMFTC